MYKKIMIIATEPSGDYLGFELMKAIKKEDKEIRFFGIGGEKMESLQFKSIIPIKELSVNGIIEVFFKLFNFIRYLNKTIKFINEKSPDILITIDSPSFNYRLVKKLQHMRKKTKFVHYVAPTVWAWKKYRAKQFSKAYDLLLTLFSFEPKYFSAYKLKTKFVGHPFFFQKKNYRKLNNKKKIISFYPGSRPNEIKKIFPKLLEVMKVLKKYDPLYEIKVVTLPNLVSNINKIMENENFYIVSNASEKKKVMENSFIAIAASGTVSLELAFYKIPMIIVYNSNFFTSFLIKNLVKVKWCSLINIIYNKEIVPELLFNNFNKKNILEKFFELSSNKKEILKQQIYFNDLPKKIINRNFNPSTLAAKSILGI